MKIGDGPQGNCLQMMSERRLPLGGGSREVWEGEGYLHCPQQLCRQSYSRLRAQVSPPGFLTPSCLLAFLTPLELKEHISVEGPQGPGLGGQGGGSRQDTVLQPGGTFHSMQKDSFFQTCHYKFSQPCSKVLGWPTSPFSFLCKIKVTFFIFTNNFNDLDILSMSAISRY